MLEAVEVRKSYGEVHALDGFTLSAHPGEIVGLVGHNGAGKTTFVEIVTGLVAQDSGSVSICGLPPARARGEVGVTPQHLGLYPSVTVREHLQLFGRLAGLRRAALSAAIEEMCDSLRLAEIMDRRSGVLSGGQQRRVQAATALIHHPRLLMLDEPTAGADLQTRQAMLDVVRARAEAGAAVVYTTHYLPELVELRATIAVAQHGRIIARGTYDELVLGLPGEVRLAFEDEGEDVAISTTAPTQTLISLLSSTDRAVTAVEVRQPSLDDLYRSLAVDDVSNRVA
ncbi:ATP-binding cassette domain-containing protein [Nakamurella sp. YIM 132087]|uniref:ATP-binding cassette domain-containing protein n=1 Tax=Nakamurella alba TaxID=2665158 RepID=A0A7K1FQ17_9ACTN|nr:ABC transporter ATP-binding protein [Nakamurella alba]MTD15343.1 ATP-binding cassette domain-containing protein [Nakamurella alba]